MRFIGTRRTISTHNAVTPNWSAYWTKENEAYKEAERRSGILTELEPHLSAIKLQDSLQWLAKLPENERNEAIDKVIEALKKQEKEEARKAMQAEMAANMPKTPTATPTPPTGNRRAQAELPDKPARGISITRRS